MADPVEQHNSAIQPIMKSILSADGQSARRPSEALVILESVTTGICIAISANADGHLPAHQIADLVAGRVRERLDEYLAKARAETTERAN